MSKTTIETLGGGNFKVRGTLETVRNDLRKAERAEPNQRLVKFQAGSTYIFLEPRAVIALWEVDG